MKKTKVYIVFASLVTGHWTYALDVGLDLTAETEYSTNSRKTAETTREEWVHRPSVNLAALHDAVSISVDSVFNLERRFYEDNLYDDENVTIGYGNIVWNAIDERLEFSANHTRKESSVRAISASTPDNKQVTSTTSAGPILRFKPRANDEIQFQYQYIDRNSGLTDTDSVSHLSRATYLTQLRQNQLSLTLASSKVQYEDELIPDLEYRTGSLGWSRTGANIKLALRGGFSSVDRVDRDEVSGGIFDLSITWEPTAATFLELKVVRDISDQATGLRNDLVTQDQNTTTNSDLGEVFTSSLIQALFERQLNLKTKLKLAVSHVEDDYEDVARDTEKRVISANIVRRLNPRMDLSIDLMHVNQRFIDENDESDTTRGEFDLNWRLGQRTTFSFGVGYEERDADSGLLTRKYDEWFTSLKLTYSPFTIE